MHDFSRSSQRVIGRMSKLKRITWAKAYRLKQCDYAIAASMTPPFPLFNLYAFDRSRATLLTMTPRREQHQTCSSRSSIKNKTVSTEGTWEEVNPGSNKSYLPIVHSSHWVQLERVEKISSECQQTNSKCEILSTSLYKWSKRHAGHTEQVDFLVDKDVR